MRSIINYFIKNQIAANLLMISILVFGYFGFQRMKSTFFPERASRLISIRLVYPGASPEEIEEGIVAKIEENLKGVTGVERITSVSSENAGAITVEVLKGYNTDLVLDDVKNAVDRINSLPDGLEPPVVYKLENIGFAISFAISGDVDLKTLKSYARKAEDGLLAIDGISKVELSGFPDEEIEITFRERDLRAYNLTFQQATDAVRGSNLEVTGGTLKGKEEELLLRARNKSYYADGFRNIVVKNSPGESVVYLHQVANITDQWSDNPSRSYLNGKPAVVITVSNTLEEDILDVVEKSKNYIKQFNASHDVVKAEVIRDGSKNLVDRINLLVNNGTIGVVIVIIFLAMFLHWRLAFWVAVAIPISFAGMFICAALLGITINVISLFGMILVIGILVDDGIVIAENIYQLHEKGVPRYQAALEGTMQVLPAVFSAILTTVIAFMTFLFLDGRLGEIFSEMAIVVIFSLIFSLVEGAFILPAHIAHSAAMKEGAKLNRVQLFFDRIMSFLRSKFYAPILKFALNYSFFTFGVVLTALIISISAFQGGVVKSTFFPVVERDNVTINLQMPAGTRENITQKWLDHIEAAAIEANKELSQRFFNNGRQAIIQFEKNLGPTSYQGNVNITMIDSELRDSLRMRDVINAVREKTGTIYDAEVLTFGAQSPFGKPINVSLVGENLEELALATKAVKEELSKLEELRDVVDSNQPGLREINVALTDKAYFLGLDLRQIISQVRSGFFGNEVQRLQRGRDEVKVWVRYAEEDRKDITQLEQMRLRFVDGREFQVSEVADLELQRGVVNINHLSTKREVRIEADIANDKVSVSDLTADIKSTIIPAVLQNFSSVTPIFEGQNREQEKTQVSINATLPIILGLMFVTIALTFRSISQTVAVFLLIPFGLIGVIWGHWLMDQPMSFFSVLGIIALIGILVNDALVFVAAYNDNLREGLPQMKALEEAALSRFRPILLTSLTTFAGLAPLLLERSFQAQFLIPMAISVSFGLLAVTLIILVLLPILLLAFNRFKYYAAWARTGNAPASFEAVEAATQQDGSYNYLWYLVPVLLALGVAIGWLILG